MQQRNLAALQRQLDDAEREGSVDTDDDALFGPPSPPGGRPAAAPARAPLRPPVVPPPPAPVRAPAPKTQAPLAAGAAKPAPPAPAAEKRAQEEPEPAAAASSAPSGGPCSNYSIDLSATEFGMCKCGHKKNAHSRPMFGSSAASVINKVDSPPPAPTTKVASPPPAPPKAAQPPPPQRVPAQRHEEEQEPEAASPSSSKHACENYQVNLAATEFNMCKCGFKKSDHARQTGVIGSLAQPAPRPAAAPPARAPVVIERSAPAAPAQPVPANNDEDEGGACDEYRVDLAAAFGTCKCGRKKTEHSARALGSRPGSFRGTPLAMSKPPAPEPSKVKPAPAQFGAKARALRMAEASGGAGRIAPPAFATVARTSSAAAAAAAAAAPPPPPPPSSHEREPEPEAPAPSEEEDREEQVPVVQEEPPAVAEEEPVAALDGASASGEGGFPKALNPPQLFHAEYDFPGQAEEDLVFKQGDILEVFEILDENWLMGRIQGTEFKGVFPIGYAVKMDESSTAALATAAVAEEPAAAHYDEAAAREAEEAVARQQAEEQEAVRMRAEQEAAEAAARQREAEEEAERQQQEAAEAAARQREAEEEAERQQHEAEERQRREAEEAEERERQAKAEAEAAATSVAATEPGATEEAEAGVPFSATAIYDYQGGTPDDLSFSAGDVIKVLAIIDAEWWHGTLNGAEGIFPCSYVSKQDDTVEHVEEHPAAAAPVHEEEEEAAVAQEEAALLAVVTATALFDFEPQTEDDLGFVTGDVITVVEVIDNDWLRGALHGKEGLVPRAYVDLVDA